MYHLNCNNVFFVQIRFTTFLDQINAVLSILYIFIIISKT